MRISDWSSDVCSSDLISIDASGATIVAWTAGFKLTPYLVLGAGYHPIGLRVQQVYAQPFDASGAAAGKRATIEHSVDRRHEDDSSPAVAFNLDGGYVLAQTRTPQQRLQPTRTRLYRQ